MKNTFFILLTFLILFTQFMVSRRVTRVGNAELSTIHWITGINAARLEEIKVMNEWLAKRPGPRFVVNLDAQNMNSTKMIIQGVSGVGSELMDIYGGIGFYDDIGILQDLGDTAKTNGFGLADTFPAVVSDISVNGRQVGYPANIGLALFLANLDTFKSVGLEPPTGRWSFEQFEALGREFVKRANASPTNRVRSYFAFPPNMEVLRRLARLSMLNETLTECGLDAAGYISLLKRYRAWMYEDRIFPSEADISAMSVGGSAAINSAWGVNTMLFITGKVAMHYTGRWSFVEFRQYGFTNVRIVPLPDTGFPNCYIFARPVAVYKGSSPTHKFLALQAMSFFGSREYNLQVIHDGDGLPPNPKYLSDENFVNPKDHPYEGPLNLQYVEAANTIAIAMVVSPFIQASTVNRIERLAVEAFLNGRGTAEETAQTVIVQINNEIKRSLARNPALVNRYTQALMNQMRINEVKSNGKRVPAELVENIYLKRLYRHEGKLGE